MIEEGIKSELLSLLRAGLWGEGKTFPDLHLDAAQWENLYRVAKEHTVEGVVYAGVQGLPVHRMPPRDLLLKWCVRIDQIERRNQQMDQCIAEQFKIFKDRNLNPLLLKGQGVASSYPIPHHRVCGDVDWYFKNKGFKKANTIIEHADIKVSHQAGFSTEYKWKGIEIEHHKRMFDIHNPFCAPFLKNLIKKRPDAFLEVHEQKVLIPEPMCMAIQVNVHILKHLLSFGVGLRQLCDAARVYYSNQGILNGEELRKAYKRLGILPWIQLLHSVLVTYIGLPKESLPFDLAVEVDSSWMMDEIWSAGNFGFYDGKYDEKESFTGKRVDTPFRIWSNVRKYYKYAPGEAISFPPVQFYSKYVKN